MENYGQSSSPEFARSGQTARHSAAREIREKSMESFVASVTQPPPTDYDQTWASSQRWLNTQLPQLHLTSSPGSSVVEFRGRRKLVTTFMPRLSQAAVDLVRHLATSPDQEFWPVELDGFREAFKTYLKYYMGPGDFLIDQDEIRRLLDYEPRSPACFTASSMVALANLTILLAELAGESVHSPLSRLEVLEALDNAFPQAFLPDSDTISDILMSSSHSILDVALEIRVQRVIATMREGGEMDGMKGNELLEMIARLFLCPGSSQVHAADLLYHHHGATANLKSLGGINLNAAESQQEQARCLNIMRFLCETLNDEGNGINWAAVDEQFPEARLPRDLASLAREWFARIDSPFDMHSQPRETAPPEVMGEEASWPASSDGMMGHYPPPPQTQPQPPGPLPPSTDEAVYPNLAGVVGSDGSGAYVSPSQDSERQVQGDSYAMSTAVAGGVRRSKRRPRNRQHGGEEKEGQEQEQEQEEDDDDDDEYQTPADTHSPNELRHRRRNAERVAARRTRLARARELAASAEYASSIVSSQQQHDLDLHAINESSKANARASREPKRPQTRVPWSAHDCHLLIKAVDAFRCRWADIAKANFPFDHPRNQQAVRDKARLLKQDFLKADAILPPGFDLVVLGKKERQAVVSVGRNPWRKEEDVDQEGRPVNIEYQLEQDGKASQHADVSTEQTNDEVNTEANEE